MSCGNPFPEHRCTYKCAEKQIDALQSRVNWVESELAALEKQYETLDKENARLRKVVDAAREEVKSYGEDYHGSFACICTICALSKALRELDGKKK